MKQRIVRYFAQLLVCTLFLGTSSIANASSTRASDYFAYTDVWTTCQGNGRFIIEFDINTTHIMQQVGAKSIVVWEQQDDGSYDSVKTFTSGLIDTNVADAYRMVSYDGVSGVKYYVTVALYAKDSQGSETLYRSTPVFTA